MASVGDIFAIIEKGINAIEYLQGMRLAPKQRAALQDKIGVSLHLLNALAELQAWTPSDSEGSHQQGQALESFKTEIHNLQETLGTSPNWLKRVIKRALWPRKQIEIQAKVNDLQQALGAIKAYQELSKEQQLVWKQIREWLTPRLAENLMRTQYPVQVTQGTGEGLLRSTEFREWISTKKGGVLWCCGQRKYLSIMHYLKDIC
jgi:hypothetical protein